jgi:type II secretory pathway component GspD/PulD (secretin)
LKDPLVYGHPNDIGPGSFQNTVPTGALFGVPNDTADGINYVIPPVGAPIRLQQGFAPIGVVQDHNDLTDALAEFDVGSFAGVAAANPALAVGIQFLDDIQVDLLIEATQADRRAVVLTAPRLTFFNGQRSFVAVTNQQAFVSSLDAVTGDASGAFQPNVDTLNDGFVLDVEGVISADRRYVTMTVLFSFAEFLGFRESDAAEVTGAAGGGGGDGDGDGDATEFTGFVELPQLRVSTVNTTVSVPDKGTVLLGGQRQVDEVEVETGVPVLSKIPFLNRFFTNRVTAKEEQTLLILIRPEIIIQQENEDLLFPGLNDALFGGGTYIR